MTISRRGALIGATAAAVVAGVPGAVQGDEPLLAMEREWLAQRDYIHRFPHESDAEIEPLYERQDALEKKIMETPAHSFAGIAVKLRLAGYYTWSLNGCAEGLDFDRQIMLMTLRDLERLAKEARS